MSWWTHVTSGGRYQPPTPGEQADTTLASLTRDQWPDYMSRFVPQENNLINFATSPSTVSDAVNHSGGLVNDAFAAAPGEFQRQTAGMGVNVTPEQQQAYNQQMGLNQSLAHAQASNQARTTALDQQMGAMSGVNARPDTTQMGVQR